MDTPPPGTDSGTGAAPLPELGVIPLPDGRGYRMCAQVCMTWEVWYSLDLLRPDNPDLASMGPTHYLVVDSGFWREGDHAARVLRYYRERGIGYQLVTVEGGEASKTLDNVHNLAATLNGWGVGREGPIVAIGGGAVLDLVRLAASLYRRGTRVVCIPTTLLAQVDASMGPKNGVNHGDAKNRLGTYDPAALTLIDRTFLATVDPAEIRSGMAEVVKAGVAASAELFGMVEIHGPSLVKRLFQGTTPDADAVIDGAVHVMLTELQRNPIETEKKRAMDFGHAIGPTVELRGGLRHGEAVAVDMALFAAVSASRPGLLSRPDLDRVLSVLAALKLPLLHRSLTTEAISDTLRELPKQRGGMQNLPLLTGIGSVTWVHDVTQGELLGAVQRVEAWATHHGVRLDPTEPRA